MNRAFIIATLVGFGGTFLAVFLGCVRYSMIGSNLGIAFEPVWKWPLFTMATMLTTLSVSVPFVAHFYRVSHDPAESIAAYALGYLWLPFFLFAPVSHAPGEMSIDNFSYTWFGVCLAQYFAAKIVLREICIVVDNDTV